MTEPLYKYHPRNLLALYVINRNTSFERYVKIPFPGINCFENMREK